MASIQDDRRLDPRVKAASTPEAVELRAMMDAALDQIDDEIIAPSTGLDISTIEIEPQPDGNTIRLQVIIEVYRLLLRAGVSARGKVMLGTMHGQEIFSIACPDVSADTALSIADFARTA